MQQVRWALQGRALPIQGVWASRSLVLVATLLLLLAACAPDYVYKVVIPAQADWIECGPIFGSGSEGEWDFYLWGGFASTVVKMDGVFFLYSQGADGYGDNEGTVTGRSMGVATSWDGFHFTKYEGNPVLTWFPCNSLEEGAVSGGAFLDAGGEIAMYYGANSWAGGTDVNADGRLATSSDGVMLVDQGIVLDHTQRSVWAWGDELFPVIGFHDSERWFTYYIPNGVRQEGRRGVASGESPDELVTSAPARSGLRTIAVWGPGSFARVGDEVYALFTNDVYRLGGPVLEVRTVSLDAPARLSAPLESYQFDNVWEAIVYLDTESDTWLMYYRSADHEYYGLKMAAADRRDLDCPTARADGHPGSSAGGTE